jgi:hypothetical protein
MKDQRCLNIFEIYQCIQKRVIQLNIKLLRGRILNIRRTLYA